MTSRHVVITGAAGGIGLACAEAFAADGDRVTGVDAREDELATQMRELGTRHGIDTLALSADLADAECAGLLDTAADRLGEVDVLINAAGIYPATPWRQLDAQTWDRVQHVNVRAPMLLTLALAARTEARRSEATGENPDVNVVNISSGAAIRARPGAAHYCTSKAALEMVTKACAVELAEAGIRVNAVAPGFVAVDSEANPVTEEYAAAVGRNPLGRLGQPADIAAAVVWLASPQATFATGALLRIDGGATAGTRDLPLHHSSATAIQRPSA